MQIAHRRRRAAAAIAISAVTASAGVGAGIIGVGVGVAVGDGSSGPAGVLAGAILARVRLSRITRFGLRPFTGGADLHRDSRPNAWGSHRTKHTVFHIRYSCEFRRHISDCQRVNPLLFIALVT